MTTESDEIRELLKAEGCPDYVSSIAMIQTLIQSERENKEKLGQATQICRVLFHMLGQLIEDAEIDLEKSVIQIRIGEVSRSIVLADVIRRMREQIDGLA